MPKTLTLAFLWFAALGLAACEAIAPGNVSSSPGAAGGAAPSLAESACMAAVSNRTSNGDVVVLNSEFSEAGTLVMIGVGQDRAPWRCLSANDGTVEDVFFAGSEGYL